MLLNLFDCLFLLAVARGSTARLFVRSLNKAGKYFLSFETSNKVAQIGRTRESVSVCVCVWVMGG